MPTPDISEAGMSAYLADRIAAHPGITVRTSAEVIALHGEDHLEAITLRTATHHSPQDINQPCLACSASSGPLRPLAGSRAS